MVKRIMERFESLLPYSEAVSIFDAVPWHLPGRERVNIEDAAGKISACSVFSPMDIPDKNKAAMDGYAVKHINTSNASDHNPARLELSGVNMAGGGAGYPLKDGQCREIYTGSIMPEGADAVIKVENCEQSGDYIYIYSPVLAGENVASIGEDISRGSLILGEKSIIRPQNISSMTAAGIKSATVYRNITIGIVNTGRELVTGQINNSTGSLLRSFYRRAFMDIIDGGMADDSVDSIIEKISNIRKKCDIIIVTGGSSLGRKDLTTDAISRLGKMLFSGVSIRPGRTIALFNVDNMPVLSVSGLPVAALMSSLIFVNRYVQNAFGLEITEKAPAILEERIHNKTGFTTFQVMNAFVKGGELYARPLETTASGRISSLLMGNSFTLIGENLEGMEKGSRIIINVIGDIKWE
ncbi:MAG: molybdopterin molybdotransferase MoeA [Ferroplasma sp.]|uniref:molybdopterin molybdotransferase MoeA n=1 Tax=Ferroplasma sp. TaxID=2591003 RepID=UPI0028163C11|nr:molybdopterin molybdotransferase MoeA [Ferroplasma sp.]WMT51008.1 MAG: molybdopterin molybdotransferase MoeA [Ferroplasma sp.]